MSLVTALRDYTEHLITTSFNLAENQTILGLIQATLAYLFHTFKYLVSYLATFQWFRDVKYLPLFAPQVSFSVLNESLYPLDNSLVNLFTVLQPSIAQSNKLLVGFVNSFFVSLPLSCAHVLIARRLIVEGVPAGVASAFGTVIGQSWLLVCVVCGLRGFVVPWLSLEPLTYFVGLCLLVSIIYNMAHERTIRVVAWRQKGKLLAIFLVNLALTLCEQAGLFFHLSNLSLGAEPSFLESAAASIATGGLVAHGSYLLSFFIGSLLFTGLFSCLFLFLKEAWLRQSRMTNSRIIRRLNWVFQMLILTLSFASIPYYGVDYLFFKGAGFLPGDKALQGTVIYPHTLNWAGSIGHVSGGTSFDTDVSPFDRGWYINPERRFAWSYEHLNYQAELSWLRRFERLPTFQKKKLNRRWTKWLRTRFHTLQNPALEKSLREEWLRGKRKLARSREKAREARRVGYLPYPKLWPPLKKIVRRVFLDRSFVRRGMLEQYICFLRSRCVYSGISSPLYKRSQPRVKLLEKRFKKRFYDNRIYKLLLRVDIDTFLGRQPSHRLISPSKERALSRDRAALSLYYNSLREYRKMIHYNKFKAWTLGSRSYSDRAYNQQFKGTVKVVRKLFSVTLDPYRNPSGRRVIKYDQPLPNGKGNPILHEEVGALAMGDISRQPTKRGKSRRKSSFVEETDPRPLYAGWDEQLRKMVITNRFLPRTTSLYERRERSAQTTESWQANLHERKEGRSQDRQAEVAGSRTGLLSLPFTAWPIDQEGLSQPKSTSKVPYETSFDCANDPIKKTLLARLKLFTAYMSYSPELRTWPITSWPENLRVYRSKKTNQNWNIFRKVFPPTRGGFVWPGNQKLGFDITKLFRITRS